MDGIESLITEDWQERVKVFKQFVAAFKQAKASNPVFSFEEDDERQVTFRYMGERLRIRHVFELSSDDRSMLERSTDRKQAIKNRWGSLQLVGKLKPVEAKDQLSEEGIALATLAVEADGKFAIIVPGLHPGTGPFQSHFWITKQPEKAFEELLARRDS